jgi:prepilin-type N-terminal cleavage/methylation domain-containing protein
MNIRRKKGFTLIELLVVIAIIALLLSIVMPALKESKKQARAVICRSNIKQWGIIFSLYAYDNEDSLPQSVSGARLSAKEAYWITATLPYYEDEKIRLCPSTRIDKEIEFTGGDRSHGGTFLAWGPLYNPDDPAPWWGDFDTGSYGLNEWCSNPPPSATSIWGFPIENVWRTITVTGGSRIPLFMDSVYVDGFPHMGFQSQDYQHLVPNSPLTFNHIDRDPRWDTSWGDWGSQAMRLHCIDRHKGGINGVFLDMSVRKIGLKELWKLKWHRNYEIGNTWTESNAPWPDWMRGFK